MAQKLPILRNLLSLCETLLQYYTIVYIGSLKIMTVQKMSVDQTLC